MRGQFEIQGLLGLQKCYRAVEIFVPLEIFFNSLQDNFLTWRFRCWSVRNAGDDLRHVEGLVAVVPGCELNSMRKNKSNF